MKLFKGVKTPNSARPKGARNVWLRANRKRKRDEAAARQIAREARTPREQVARLDAAFGAGSGAARERARLALLLAAQARAVSGAATVLKKVPTPEKRKLPPLSSFTK